jgi:hypothetical protein
VVTHKKMILYQRKNNPIKKNLVNLINEPYLIINMVFAGVILLIFVYSAFFSPFTNDYPVPCLHEKLTGESCISCGLSHSFSLILKGRVSEAYNWNLNGMRVFLFFASQLLLRLVFSLFYMKFPDPRRQLIVTDCIGSGLILLISFWPFIKDIFSAILFRL